jgi:hypothetical protein
MELVKLSTTTTGTTGSATNAVTSSDVITGKIHGVYVTVPSGGTCTCTLAMQAHGDNILSLTAIDASAWYYPRKAVCDNTGVALTYNGTANVYDKYAVNDHLVLTITSATTAKTFTADIFVE